MRQCGVIRAESVEEAFNWCKFLSNTPFPSGENTVIITNGGGIGVMATDACEKYGVKLYDDTEALKEAFSTVTPDFGSTKNPVDLTGQADLGPLRFGPGTRRVKNDQIHSVIALYCETAVFDAENLCRHDLGERRSIPRRTRKPLVFSIFGGEKIETCLVDLEEEPRRRFTGTCTKRCPAWGRFTLTTGT